MDSIRQMKMKKNIGASKKRRKSFFFCTWKLKQNTKQQQHNNECNLRDGRVISGNGEMKSEEKKKTP